MIYETASVEQFEDRSEERSRKAIALKAVNAIAFSLLISISFCTEVYGQGEGESISFERIDRRRNDEVFVEATAFAFNQGGIRPDIGTNQAAESVHGSLLGLTTDSSVIGVLIPPPTVFDFAPNLALNASTRESFLFENPVDDKDSITRGTGTIDAQFDTSPGLATFIQGQNEFATLEVFIYFLHVSIDADTFGSGRASLTSQDSQQNGFGGARTNLSFERMDDSETYMITGTLSSTSELLSTRDFGGQNFLAVSGGGVNHLVRTTHIVNMNNETLLASTAATCTSQIPGGLIDDPSDDLVGFGQTDGQTSVTLFFAGYDKYPMDGVLPPGATQVFISVSSEPFNNVNILGPVFIGANAQPTITVDDLEVQEFKVIDTDNPNEPAGELNSDFQLTLTAGEEVVATFDKNSPEVNFDAATGCVEVDFSPLNLPPRVYSINIGEGFSQQYYVRQLGDINRDGNLNFLDISGFVRLLSTGTYQIEGDMNANGTVDFLDISPFIRLLTQ